jgi:hypothetical protein
MEGFVARVAAVSNALGARSGAIGSAIGGAAMTKPTSAQGSARGWASTTTVFLPNVNRPTPSIVDVQDWRARWRANTDQNHGGIEVAIHRIRVEPTAAYRPPPRDQNYDLGTLVIRAGSPYPTKLVFEAPLILLMDEWAHGSERDADDEVRENIADAIDILTKEFVRCQMGAQKTEMAAAIAEAVQGAAATLQALQGVRKPSRGLGKLKVPIPLAKDDVISLHIMGSDEVPWVQVYGVSRRDFR